MTTGRSLPAIATLRILIVEDEALVAMELEMILAGAGHAPGGIADDIGSTRKAVQHCRPQLALVDMQLAGGVSGLEVAAMLRQVGVPVLFLTGNCPGANGHGLALRCLHKPATDAAILAAVQVAASCRDGSPLPRIPAGMHLYGCNRLPG